MSSNFKRKGEKGTRKVVVSNNVKDYSKEPFFVKQAEESRKVIEKYGLPKHFSTGKRK